MGAYFFATLDEKKMFNTFVKDQGAKLMEHSYLKNYYVNTIMKMILNKPTKLIWLCDYTKGAITWNKVNRIKKYKSITQEEMSLYIDKGMVINHTLGVYFSYKKIRDLWNPKDKELKDWIIHPIPILSNSEDSYSGGGDYGPDDSRRATWKNHLIEFRLSNYDLNSFRDVSNDVIFYE